MLNILSAINKSPYYSLVEKATSEQNTSEDWQQIVEINDRVAVEQNGPKECMRCIVGRLNSDVPWVIMQTLTLLDSLISNSGKRFHLEVCSREFEAELLRLIRGKNVHHKVSERTRLLLKKWAKEFRKDPQLNLIPSLYEKLKSEGVSFHSSDPSTKRKAVDEAALKNPDYVANAEEEANIAKALELSMQEAQKRGIKTDTAQSNMNSNSYHQESLYPSFNMAEMTNENGSTANKKAETQDPAKVRAMYDFTAGANDELTFKAGEIILLLDSSDPYWWKGSNHRGEGLFPSSFVSKDLNAMPSSASKGNEKKVQFNEEVKVVKVEKEEIKPEDITIDEAKIDRTLSLLQEADPKCNDDPEELLRLEEQCSVMMPLIDQQMEKIDKLDNVLGTLNQQLSSALNFYHELMKESSMMEQMASLQLQYHQDQRPSMPSVGVTYSSPPHHHQQSQQQQPYPMVNGVYHQPLQQQQPQPGQQQPIPSQVPSNFYGQTPVEQPHPGSYPAQAQMTQGQIPNMYQSPTHQGSYHHQGYSDGNAMAAAPTQPDMMTPQCQSSQPHQPPPPGGQMTVTPNNHHNMTTTSSAAVTPPNLL